MPNSPLGITLIVVLCALIWPWTVLAVVAQLTGWRKVARAYPERTTAADADRGWPTSVIFKRMGRYNNCVRWKVDDTYLHLRMIPPFNLALHSPMSIPWGEVDDLRVAGGTLRGGFAEMHVAGVRLRVPMKLVKRELLVRKAMGRDGSDADVPSDT